MVGLLNSFDMNRFLSNTGGIVGATVYFYYTGTSNLAPIYSDRALTIPATNPVTVAQGSLVPVIFLDSTIQYRRRIVFSDTTVYDIDPIAIPEGLSPLLAASTGATLVGTANDGTVQQAITNTPKFSNSVSYPNLTIGNKLKKQPYVTDAPYDAVGDGVTDDHGAFTAADSSGYFVVPAANYYIASSISLASNIKFLPGATLIIPNGVTVTFNGRIDAGATQIFNTSGTGAVVFGLMPLFGFSEWWGVIPNSSGAATTNLAAMNAALVALQTTQMLAEDYWFSGTIIHKVGGHILRGTGLWYDGSTAHQATRILSTSNSAPIIQVGLSTFPGSINAMPFGIRLENVYLNRSVAPLISSACDGVQLQFCVSSTLQNVKSADSMNSFHFTGVVSSYAIDCQAVRAVAGTGAGTDTWTGYFVDGNTFIGAAGGNASLYLVRCNAGCNISALQTTSSNGFHLVSGNYGFQDTFLDHCETVSCYIGTLLDGGAGGTADVHILHQIDDQCKKYGLLASNMQSNFALDLTDYYCGPSSSAQFAMYFNNCLGAVNIKGGQLLMSGLSGVQAVNISGSVGVAMRGLMITELVGAVGVAVANSSNCVIEPILHNATHSTTAAAVQLSGTTAACRVAPLVYGQSNGYGFGIQVLGTSDARNEYNCSGIDSSTIAFGSGNKLVRNGVQITSTGLTGSNLASGVMT